MKKTTSIFIIAAVLVISLAAYFSLTALRKNGSTPDVSSGSYFTYTNSARNYSFELPQGWGIADDDGAGKPSSSVVIIPSSDRHVSHTDALKVDIKKTKVIDVTTITPKDQASLDKSYSEIFKNSIPTPMPSPAPVVKEVKKTPMVDCLGVEYAVRSATRIYVIQTCYPDSSVANEMEGHVDHIVSTLKEI